MEQRSPIDSSQPAKSPCPMNKNLICGDEELDEETMNYLSALYMALGPLLPEVTKLQSNQDPPPHLMADLKSKLRELGSSVSDAKNMLLQYNVYLKKILAKASREQKILKEQQGEDTSKPKLPPLESLKPKPLERVHRRTGSCLASLGEDSKWPLQEQAEEHTRAYTSLPRDTEKH